MTFDFGASWFRVWLAFIVTVLSAATTLYFTQNSLATTLDFAFPQIVFPNPVGSFFWSLMYGIPIGLVAIIPIIIIANPETES